MGDYGEGGIRNLLPQQKWPFFTHDMAKIEPFEAFYTQKVAILQYRDEVYITFS